MEESNNKKTIVICNWCMRPGEGTLTINLQEQIKKFCSESCFSRWRRSIFKYEKICDSCKKDIKCVQSPFFYYLKEYDQHFQHCSYLCFLSFKEILSYKMIKSNSFNKFMNRFFSQNMFYGMMKQESYSTKSKILKIK
ncbi:sine oculis-binding -like protein [Brachionus plicatilis]|uniref:Sine oculis-binding-like protein n=1 Tax=Brachionus plicatilis TaxID=10195 RepID=A0A3M7P306_BRAPC|nr:sine oculis-binding -like protein [Brachionus plicatilis]